MTDRVAILNMLSELRESTKNQEVRIDNLDKTIQNVNTMVKHLVGCIKSDYNFENMVNKLEMWNLATDEEIRQRNDIIEEGKRWYATQKDNSKYDLNKLDLGI